MLSHWGGGRRLQIGGDLMLQVGIFEFLGSGLLILTVRRVGPLTPSWLIAILNDLKRLKNSTTILELQRRH